MAKKEFKLIHPETGAETPLPVLEPVVGPPVIDVTKIYAQTGAFTYDPGFTATASCQSAVTYIDGEKGVLQYRGYPIEQLAERSSFIEVAYLLLHGELPTAELGLRFSDSGWFFAVGSACATVVIFALLEVDRAGNLPILVLRACSHFETLCGRHRRHQPRHVDAWFHLRPAPRTRGTSDPRESGTRRPCRQGIDPDWIRRKRRGARRSRHAGYQSDADVLRADRGTGPRPSRARAAPGSAARTSPPPGRAHPLGSGRGRRTRT